MAIAIITGSAGLIGSEAAAHFADAGYDVVGIDNDMRKVFFGDEASTVAQVGRLKRDLGASYAHHSLDIRDREGVAGLFAKHAGAIGLVIHTAAQPSHDWAASQPFVDYDINATGTLNLLEAARAHAVDAPFIFTSTNKVYGDRPNTLPLTEQTSRYEIDPAHEYTGGISESMSIDRCLHSLFGASKLAADVLVQEYGRYFDMPTVCFRGGTLTGPRHAAAELHGFLGYVMRCAISGDAYTVFGYKGKQVRDAIHSSDLIAAFDAFAREPRVAEVYNIGGGRLSNCSVLEAIELCEQITGRSMQIEVSDQARTGDHIWWISDNSRFESHYPAWKLAHDVESILRQIHEANLERWSMGG